MARAPRPGTVRLALEPLLGRARCAELQAALIVRAAAWAADVAPGAVHVAFEPVDAAPELRELLGPQVALFPQHGAGISGRLAQAAARLFAHGRGPLLIVWPELARWRPVHATAALSDLADGYDLAVGPQYDGGFYMIVLARPLAALFALPERAWRGPDAFGLVLGAAQAAGVEIGMLRVERGLRRPEDVRAVLADPLTDPEIRAILG